MQNKRALFREMKHPYFLVSAESTDVIRYLRYIGESEDRILKLIDRLFAQKYYVPSRPDMSKYYKPAYAMAKRLP